MSSAAGKKSSTQQSKTIQNRSRLVPFLRKLQLLCENAPAEVARWSADGKQFDVLDPKGFEELLKVYFEGAAPATFHRQLFFYGWVKLNPSNGGGDEKTKGTFSFRHPCFLRDEPSKIYEIKRYARASEREEEEDGSRVDVLERRVSALQNVVDDLSRKLAAVQVSLERMPSMVPEQVGPKSDLTESLTSKSDLTESLVPSTLTMAPLLGRKRVRDLDEDSLESVMLEEKDVMELFDSSDSMTDDSFAVDKSCKPEDIEFIKPAAVSEDTTKFLSLCLSTPGFHAAMSASAASTKLQESNSNKDDVLNGLQLVF